MQDRISLYPGRVQLTPVAGQENIFDMVRADQPIQEGTPLNKATLLSDEVAEKLRIMTGQNTPFTPNDALESLIRGIGNIHVWRASGKLSEPGYSLDSAATVILNKYWWGASTAQYADAVNIADNGSVTLVEPISTVSIDYYDSDVKDNASKLLGKFGIVHGDDSVYFFPTGQTPYAGYISSVDDTGVTISGQKVISYPAKYGSGYITDVNSDAYPEDGTLDDTIYRYCGTLASGAARIEAGSYTGTGLYGSSNPNSLTFGFVPKIVFIGWINSNTLASSVMIFVNNNSNSYSVASIIYSGDVYSVNYKISDKTVSWYTTSSAQQQNNGANSVYQYLAIG